MSRILRLLARLLQPCRVSQGEGRGPLGSRRSTCSSRSALPSGTARKRRSRPTERRHGSRFRRQIGRCPPSLARRHPKRRKGRSGMDIILSGPKSAPKAFHPRRRSLSRGPGSIPGSSQTRRSQLRAARPPIGTPLLQAARLRSWRSALFRIRYERSLAKGAQPRDTYVRWSEGVRPARRWAVVRCRRATERLSTMRTATPSWGENTSRAEFRRRM
jgi:hypothetical protein